MEEGPLLKYRKGIARGKAKYRMRIKTFLVTRKIFAEKQHLS